MFSIGRRSLFVTALAPGARNPGSIPGGDNVFFFIQFSLKNGHERQMRPFAMAITTNVMAITTNIIIIYVVIYCRSAAFVVVKPVEIKRGGICPRGKNTSPV